MVEQVIATKEALKLIELIKSRHGAIMFYQSGGCCEGSVPMCYVEGDFKLGDNDIYLGTIGDVPFYIHRAQYEYFKHTQLIIDAMVGRGASFSLDSVEEMHFITKSKVFTADEYEEVKKLF
ncbi:DUF779 domain-containing protein [Lysinibacillus sp. NPDC048646]|uniref:Acetaldehyde dehydrogenase n=1 Tax=Lysinibacillus sphaericus OT4b.31 TaxID=1285586 RepID=R7ZIL9_LYSSH|nr:DUF779 domain-containing protein [Lysinibacillus sphaericus]EON73928.1 hypothetical protein H131_04664 [Lysinibacillus sphaericus OT4b.31]